MRKTMTKALAAVLLAGCLAVPAAASETGVVKADVLNVRSGPSTDDKIIGKLKEGTKVEILERGEDDWCRIAYPEEEAYVLADYLADPADDSSEENGKEKTAGTDSGEDASEWDGPVLTKSAGVVMGPSGKETYYNLDMSGVIQTMRNMGNTDEYWIREDGCKMLGDYIMCAANLDVHPRGSLVESSLGTCIVCDTGGFAAANPNQLDIAVNW